MEFMKFPKIKIFGHDENKDIFAKPEDRIKLEAKYDGCISYAEKIHTDKGMIQIGKLVNKKMNVKALSLNGVTGKLEYKKITKYHKNKVGDNWVKIRYQHKGKVKSLVITDNHVFFDGKKYRTIKEIWRSGKEVVVQDSCLTEDQRELLIGSIIGDCSFRQMNHKTKMPLYSETHGIKQKRYLNFKKEILKNFISNEDRWFSRYSKEYRKTEKIRIYSYSSIAFKELEYMYKNGKKQIPKKLRLSEKALAILYCDDGTPGISKTQRPRAQICLNSYSYEECKTIQKEIKGMGIVSSLKDYGKGYQLYFSQKDTERLFCKIARWIPECMNVKIPGFENVEKGRWSNNTISIRTAKIIDYKPFNPVNRQRYDIEVEDNHNYFVKGVLVHNSNFRFMVKNGVIIFGSRTQQLTSDEGEDTNVAKAFRHAIDFIRHLLNKRDISQFENKVFFCENMVKHSMDYDWDRIPIVLGYDVYCFETNKFLDNAEEIYNDMGIEFVPKIWEGTAEEASKLEINENLVPVSKYAPKSNPEQQEEGIVFKNHRTGVYAKFVRQSFKEENSLAFGGTPKYTEDDTGKICATYCTNSRIEKAVFFFVDMGDELDMPLMRKIVGYVYADIWEENWKAITKKYKEVKFREMRKIIMNRCRVVLQQVIINNKR